MWAKRIEQLRDVSLVVDLDPRRCLDAADVLARHAPRYGIRADLELRRNHSGAVLDRHYVLCHRAGGRIGGAPNAKPLWIAHLVLVDQEPGLHVLLGVHTYRRRCRGVEAGRALEQYRDLLTEALVRLDEGRHGRGDQHRDAGRVERWGDNVIPLRPYLDFPPTASA